MNIYLNIDGFSPILPGYAWCGWISDNHKYAAIWRYTTTGSFDDLDDQNDADRELIVEGIYTGDTLELYKFDFSSNPPQLIKEQDIVVPSSAANTPTTGYSTITIPNVDENPTIIKFLN